MSHFFKCSVGTSASRISGMVGTLLKWSVYSSIVCWIPYELILYLNVVCMSFLNFRETKNCS